MLGLQIHSPSHRYIEVNIFTGENIDGLRIGQVAILICVSQQLQLGRESVFYTLGEEGDIVFSCVQKVAGGRREDVNGELLEVGHGGKTHLRLHHPELTQVAGGVGVLSTEGGTKGVHTRHGMGEHFGLELAGHGEICLGIEEGGEILFAILVNRNTMSDE